MRHGSGRSGDASEGLNAIVAPDAYTVAATISGTPIQRILLDVSNQAIYWQLQKASYGAGVGVWEDVETYMIPGSRTLVRQGVTGIRIRAAIKLANIPVGFSQAVVTVEAVK